MPDAADRTTWEDTRPTLLIADDDPVLRLAIGSQLGAEFRVVALACNAVEAIALAEEHQPDAAVIDVSMPGGGARTAVPRIVAGSPRTCMVILSADESQESVVELLNAGAVAYLRKGSGGLELAKTLADALSARPALPAP